jgi:dihydrofolate reductase
MGSMRKLVLSMVLSVDGYANALGGEFVPPAWSADMDRWTFDMIDRFDTLLYGRAAWAEMAAYWPAAEQSAESPEPHRRVARFMNGSRKIVFSRSLKDATAWTNSTIATGTVADVVRQERLSASDKDLVIFAGPTFAQTVMRENLIDEYWLLTMPKLFGGGARLFQDHALRQDLALIEARVLDTGSVLTRYVRK